MSVCNYCKNQFSSKKIMESHQRKTKYCLEIQKQNNPDVYVITFDCDFCDKKFLRKGDYSRHQETCKLKHSNDITELILLKQEIQVLKNENIDLKLKNAVLEAKLEERTKNGDEFKSLHSKREECIEKIALQPKTTTKNTSNSTQNNILNNLPIFNLTKESCSL